MTGQWVIDFDSFRIGETVTYDIKTIVNRFMSSQRNKRDMTGMALPQGWKEVEEPHPDHGVVADSHSRYRHNRGFEINIWSGVMEDARDYTVEESDEYAVEVYGKDEDYIEGKSFDTEQEAVKAAREAMNRFPL
jgi:hypothetical protein